MLSWLADVFSSFLTGVVCLLLFRCCACGLFLWHVLAHSLYLCVCSRASLSDGEPSVISLSCFLPSWIDSLFNYCLYRSVGHIPRYDTEFCPWKVLEGEIISWGVLEGHIFPCIWSIAGTCRYYVMWWEYSFLKIFSRMGGHWRKVIVIAPPWLSNSVFWSSYPCRIWPTWRRSDRDRVHWRPLTNWRVHRLFRVARARVGCVPRTMNIANERRMINLVWVTR